MNNINTKWNLDVLYSSINDSKIKKDFESDKKEVENFVTKYNDEKNYLTDSKSLLQALTDYEKILNIETAYYYYIFLNHELKNDDESIKSIYNKLSNEITLVFNKIEFFENKISKITKEQQEVMMSDKSLSKYHHFLKRIFDNSKYVLSEKEETIINLLSKPASQNWTKYLNTQISKIVAISLGDDGKKSEKTFEELLSLLLSTNKKVRDSAFNNISNSLSNLSDYSTQELNSFLETTKILRDLRGFKRYDEARHIADDIDSKVVDNLIATVWDNLKIVHDFYKLKAKLLGFEKLKYYERNVPFVPKNKKEQVVKFDEATKIVNKSLQSIDKDFSDKFNFMLQNGIIDVYPNKGKSGGAYCTHGSKNIYPYILLNYTDKINDVLTLAHEVGHGIHHMYYNKNQPAMYAHSSLAVAEVSSIICEEFTFESILSTLSPIDAFSLRFNKLQSTMNTIFRQISFYKMEQEIYKTFDENSYISKKQLQDIFLNFSKKELGSSVELVEGVENFWVYISHFRYGFYVYSYASGSLIARSIKNIVQKNQDAALLINLMKSGASKSTKELFKDVGIDITQKEFFENGISDIKKELEQVKKEAKELKLI